MSDYRMYCLDGAGKVGTGEWFEAKDDNEALAIVRAKKLAVRCEIWQRSRRIGTAPAFRP